jgi:hypothetical protein
MSQSKTQKPDLSAVLVATKAVFVTPGMMYRAE